MKRYGRDRMSAGGGLLFGIDGVMTALCYLFLLIVVVIPVVSLGYHAFFYEGRFDPSLFAAQIAEPANRAALWNTLKIAFWVTLFGTAAGTFFGWLLGRSDIPAKGLMRAMFSIPYMFPPFLGAMAWDLLLNGRSGYLNKFLMSAFHLSSAPFNINSVGGIVFVECSYYFPFVFMQVASALERMDPTLEESARIAGAGRLEVFRRVTLPLILPAVSSGALLILIASLAHFGVPSILGFSQGIYTLPTRIYAVISRTGGSFEGIRSGAALSIVLVAVMAVAFMIQKKAIGSRGYDVIRGKSMNPSPVRLRGARIPLFILCIVSLVFTVVVPLVMIFLVSLVRAYGLPLTPANFTLKNYSRIFAASGTAESIKNSLFVSAAAGVLCMIMGTLIAYVVRRIRPRGKGILEALAMLPYSLPGTVLAIGVILAWSGGFFGISLYNTIWIILIAYLARYLSFALQSSSAALLQIHPSLEDAARSCGASHAQSILDVTLPLIRPAMVSGFFLIFLPAMREVTTSILLYGPYTRTLGVQIYSLRDAGMIPQAAALGSIAIVIIVVCNAVVTQITKDRKGV